VRLFLCDLCVFVLTKLRTLAELKSIVEHLKRDGKRVVFANGCFDLLHVGHVRYLKQARALGNCLIVGLNSDESVRRLKGEGRPLLKSDDRALMLSALECVDHVVIFEDDTVDRLLLELEPHLHCKGDDYTPETIPERETLRSYGGSAAITGGIKVQSTRWLLQEIRRKCGKK
jgi:rfaE bifunctional protein nucleotidyltransferase chain/domain